MSPSSPLLSASGVIVSDIPMEDRPLRQGPKFMLPETPGPLPPAIPEYQLRVEFGMSQHEVFLFNFLSLVSHYMYGNRGVPWHDVRLKEMDPQLFSVEEFVTLGLVSVSEREGVRTYYPLYSVQLRTEAL